MKRIIYCMFYKKNSEGLKNSVYPGQLGKKIYESISQKAWLLWLSRQTILINEKKLNMFIDKDRKILEIEMKKFLFKK